jgi:hypothetical protein
MPTADIVSNSGAAAAPNPFSAQAVQDVDGGAELVDIAGLHEGARQTLLRARFRVRAGRPYLAVVVGEEGAGKSHLMWWLRRQSAASHGLFVAMGALPDVAQPFRHALKQLVSALCRKDGEGRGPFERIIDRLLWEALYAQACDLLDGARIGMYQAPGALLKILGPLCQEGGRRRELGDFATAAQPIWAQVEPGLRAYLLSLPTEMSIDTAARAVLLQYPYADRRALCTAWLAGEELSAKDRERISAKQSINNESAAKYVLCALCRLLTGSAGAGPGPGVPLTLTYDQTDAVARELGLPGVQGMAEVVSAIQAQGGATLQVLACRPDTFRMLVDKGARPGPGQLKSVDDTLQLSRPAVAQLRELVAARAGQASALSAADLDPSRWPQEVGTPRAALAYLAGLWASRTGALAIPVPANDAPTAKGLSTGPIKPPATAAKSAPMKAMSPAVTGKTNLSKPNIAAVSAKAAQSRPIAPKNIPSQPGTAVAPAKKNALSTPPAPAPKEEPSAASPSITWMAMASDEEVAPVSSVESVKKPASPKETKKPEPAKVSVKTAPQLPPNPVSIGPSPPSAQSPSVTWMAMADEDDPLARALAAVDAEDAAKGASKPRTTKERLRAVGNPPSASLRPEQVLAAFGTRDRVEEWQLAQELGVSASVLGDALARLEDQGAIRLVPVGDGQRMVARL